MDDAISKKDLDLEQAADAVQELARLLRSGEDIERIVDGYLQTRRLLSSTLQRLTLKSVQSIEPIVEDARRVVKEKMNQSFGAAMPESLMFIRPYNQIHVLLLGYLLQRLGQGVSGTRLRLLTGDQIHTERRLRELRELGFQIEVTRTAGAFHYRLVDTVVEAERAAKAILKSNIRRVKNLSESRKLELLALVG